MYVQKEKEQHPSHLIILNIIRVITYVSPVLYGNLYCSLVLQKQKTKNKKKKLTIITKSIIII